MKSILKDDQCLIKRPEVDMIFVDQCLLQSFLDMQIVTNSTISFIDYL